MAIKLNVKTSITTTRAMRLELDRQFFVDALKEMGYDLPRDAGIEVRVPGGGDWSNTSLDIDKECPVIVTWATTERSDA